MPDYRKPQVPPAGRDSPPVGEEFSFSIETTTMRLKSLKLRRAAAADQALEAQLREQDRGGGPAAPEAAGPAGRVRHDERGMAVWDWAAASGETAALSATNVMRRLDVSALSIEQTQRSLKAMQPGPTGSAVGGDPYNQHRNRVNEDPFKRGVASGDPYNRAGGGSSSSVRRPAAKPGSPAPAPPEKKRAPSVLDQLLGRKK